MSALTRVIGTTKRTLIYFVIFFISLLLISFIIYFISSSISNYYAYQRSITAQNGFGNIPALSFKNVSFVNNHSSYILDTTQNLNSFPLISPVYKLKKPIITLNSYNIASALISNMGISSTNSSTNNAYVYNWTTPHHTISINLSNLSFNIFLNLNISDYINYQNSNIGNNFNFSSLNNAEMSVYNFLSNLTYQNATGINIPLIQMNMNYFSAVPVTINNNNIEFSNSTGTIPNAYYVFYRQHIGQYKIYTNNPNKPLINFLIDNSNLSGLDGILNANYYNYTITSSSTYNIITPQEAFNLISSGKGSLVSIYPTLSGDAYNVNYNSNYQVSKFYVNNIELGYFESKNYSQYLIPIYILSGTAYLSNNQSAQFYYYVDALKN